MVAEHDLNCRGRRFAPLFPRQHHAAPNCIATRYAVSKKVSRTMIGDGDASSWPIHCFGARHIDRDEASSRLRRPDHLQAGPAAPHSADPFDDPAACRWF